MCEPDECDNALLVGEKARVLERRGRRLSVSRTSRLAAALVRLALLAPLRWSSTLLAAPQPVVDTKALARFPPVSAAAPEPAVAFSRDRVYLELIGLPPTSTQVDAFVYVPGAQAFEKVLDGLLLHLLGLDHERLTYRYQGGAFRLTDVHGKVVHEIVAQAGGGPHSPSLRGK